MGKEGICSQITRGHVSTWTPHQSTEVSHRGPCPERHILRQASAPGAGEGVQPMESKKGSPRTQLRKQRLRFLLQCTGQGGAGEASLSWCRDQFGGFVGTFWLQFLLLSPHTLCPKSSSNRPSMPLPQSLCTYRSSPQTLLLHFSAQLVPSKPVVACHLRP